MEKKDDEMDPLCHRIAEEALLNTDFGPLEPP